MSATRLKQVFFDSLQLRGPARDRFIEGEAAGDEGFAREVYRLIESHEQAGEFLTDPWVDVDRTGDCFSEKLPEEIGGRRITGKLGEGGFGVVYLAEQVSPIRMEVAIKVIRPGMMTGEIVARFDAEQRALELMKHPSIAAVLDAGVTDQGQPYFVMEYVAGARITDFVAEKGLDVPERIKLFEKVCMAVQHAHEKGVVHRDLKPSNVLVTETDGVANPKVIDFGIAKAVQGPLAEKTALTLSAQIVGTPQYMSPEQISYGAIDIDTRSDVYSLGALLYELLTGQPPFDAERIRGIGPAELEQIIRHEDPQKPSIKVQSARSMGGDSQRFARDIKRDLDWVVARAMEKERERRYHSPAALAKDLRRFLNGEAVEAGAPSNVYKLTKLIRRHRIEVAAASAVLVALIIALVVSLHWGNEAEARRLVAETQLAKAKTIVGFTEEMLAGVDPAVAKGADVRLFRSMLSRAAQRIDREAPGQPEVEVELRTLIGLAFHSISAFDLAETQLTKACDLARDHLSSKDAGRLKADSALAQVYASTGRFAGAVEMFKSVQQRRSRSLGPDDSLTIQSLSNMGCAELEAGRFEESLATQEEVLERRLRTLGGDHEDTMATRNNLAMCLSQLNRKADSIPLLQKVLEHQLKSLTEKHPRTLATLNNLASAYSECGEADEAEAMFRRILRIKRVVLTPGHPSIVIAINNLASLLGKGGKHDQAISLLEQAIDMTRLRGKKSDTQRLVLQNNLAGNLARAGRNQEALQLTQETARGLAKLIGPSHPNTMRCRSQVATLLFLTDQFDAALKELEALMVEAQKELPEGNALMPQLFRTKGRCQHALKRRSLAEATLLAGWKLADSAFRPHDARRISYLKTLRDFYKDQDDEEKAAQWSILLIQADVPESSD